LPKFGIIQSEDKVFINDKINVDFSKSVITPDETAATISHEFSADGVAYINVSSTKNIDWSFSSSGLGTFYLRLTSNTGSTVFVKQIEVLHPDSQKLFSNDFDLVPYEPDIIKWLPKKWSSWNLIHLRAQDYIINMLREKGIKGQNNVAYTKDDIFDVLEVKDLSAALALRYIFSGTSNSSEDVFKRKSDEYDKLVTTRASAVAVKLDFNKNALNDEQEIQTFRAVEFRRS